MQLHFLGTGGGRFTTIRQLRKTGGMILKDIGFSMHIDPGPGALVNARQQNVRLEQLDYLLVTHAHTDQANDAKAIIEAMTDGCTKTQGTLFASPSVLHGYQDDSVTLEPWVSTYHTNALEQCITLQEKQTYTTEHFTLQSIQVQHNDPETYGFILQPHQGDNAQERFGFITDTEYFEELTAFFGDCDHLIINVLRPRGKHWKGHMTTDQAKQLIEAVQPRTAILQHFGHLMVYASMYKEATWLKNNCEAETEMIWAQDFQTVDFATESGQDSTLRDFTTDN